MICGSLLLHGLIVLVYHELELRQLSLLAEFILRFWLCAFLSFRSMNIVY